MRYLVADEFLWLASNSGPGAIFQARPKASSNPAANRPFRLPRSRPSGANKTQHRLTAPPPRQTVQEAAAH